MAQPFDRDATTFFDLSSRAKLRVTGEDAFRFLNGQISNDLRKATRDSAIQASILNAKGKLNAIVFVSADSDSSFMLDSDPEMREELPPRLERYIIADDVQVEDVTDRFGIFHVAGQADLPAFPPSARTVQSNRYGRPGLDIWCERLEGDRISQQLSSISFCNEACEERLRVELGIPRWGRELTNEIIPTEANLEANAIDYAKGCYIGQEVISRIKTSGQTNKRLCGLVSLSGEPLQPGMRLTTDGDERKEAGWITSAVRSQRLNQEIALGYLKRGFGSVGLRLRTLSPEKPDCTVSVPVEVVVLPFL